MEKNIEKKKDTNVVIKSLETVLFSSRYFLLIFYFGLIIALLLYAFVYMQAVYHAISKAGELDPNSCMLLVLELVDMAMVANLIKQIITGSYNSFVSKDHGYINENSTSGLLKIKMSTSLVGITSIHLLQTFLEPIPHGESALTPLFYKQLIVHGTFLIGALVLAGIEYLHDKGEALNHEDGHS